MTIDDHRFDFIPEWHRMLAQRIKFGSIFLFIFELPNVSQSNCSAWGLASACFDGVLAIERSRTFTRDDCYASGPPDNLKIDNAFRHRRGRHRRCLLPVDWPTVPGLEKNVMKLFLSPVPAYFSCSSSVLGGSGVTGSSVAGQRLDAARWPPDPQPFGLEGLGFAHDPWNNRSYAACA
ncbi:hypothetical protein M8818_000664 [Zalaria obscura]|uniref:Uncharacterized protein n=1 Tax=Zalaria obscura TaxID=2024903 RepID=A0ACC3SMF7_9PEZI